MNHPHAREKLMNSSWWGRWKNLWKRVTDSAAGIWVRNAKKPIARIRNEYSERPRALREVVVLVLSSLVVFVVSAVFDLFNKIISWIHLHDTWQLDEVFTVAIYLVLAIGVYAFRRYRELVVQTRLRDKAERENERLIPELENVRADLRRLQVLLPICPSCKKVRIQSGYWEEMETYVQIKLNTRFDRGLCPECMKRMITKGIVDPQTYKKSQQTGSHHGPGGTRHTKA